LSKKDFCGVTLSVLGYREDSQWVALALEMDLRGYGDTFDKALEELLEAVMMQIGFANFKGQPDMIFHPAEPTWFSLYAQVREDRLKSITYTLQGGEVEYEREYEIGGIPVPPAHVIKKMKRDFSVMDG